MHYVILLLFLTTCVLGSPARANGRHIHCALTGSSGIGGENRHVERSFDLYLDDTNEQAITESGPGTAGVFDYFDSTTTLYSDTKVEVKLSDGTSAGVMFFGQVVQGPALLSIDRAKGEATLVAFGVPLGGEILMGPCSARSPPMKKF